MIDIVSQVEYEATVVFTTINRPKDLRKAIQSAVDQVPPVEIIVIGDGSPMEIITMVKNEFPRVRVFHSETTKGISVQRNLGAQLATSPIIFSIDDDATFTSTDTIQRAVVEFKDPVVGAVALPFIDIYRSVEHGTNLPIGDGMFVVSSFVGTAYALRRDLFLKLGGYEEALIFQGEEEDYCARLLDAGYVICAGRTAPIIHYVSPIRNWDRIAKLGARNAILYAFLNVPMPYFVVHLIGTTIFNIVNGFKINKLSSTLKGILAGYFDCAFSPIRRRPISSNTYRLIRKLRKTGPIELSVIRNQLNRQLLE